MNCSSIRPLISDYYDGEVTPEERTMVEAHLAGCEECSRALAEYRILGGDLRALSVPAPPVGLRRDVWRAIEAQERRSGVFGGASARPRGAVTSLPERKQERGKGLISVLTGSGGAWARALPAAVLVGGLLVVMLFFFVWRINNTPLASANLDVSGDLTDYGKPIHVIFSKQVISSDAENNTAIMKLTSGTPYTLTRDTEVRMKFVAGGNGRLKIEPIPTWEPGAVYEVVVDAPNIGLVIGNARLDTEPQRLRFVAASHTPTPTNTPTETPVPTNTPVPPTNTPEPTAAAEETPNANTPNPAEPTKTAQKPTSTPAAKPTDTPAPPRPSATSPVVPTATNTSIPVPPTVTPVPPTNTPAAEPTRTLPALTATPRASQTPAASPTPRTSQTAVPTRTVAPGTPGVPPRTGTATPTSTPAPAHGCDFAPVRGFGKVWQENPDLRERIGCPTAQELGIAEMVVERFEGGLMVWRGDTRMIYVYRGGPNDSFGTWQQVRDTWTETEPTPRPSTTPPPGMFEPVRGFGKLWRENTSIRNDLGWAIEEERAAGGAWQEFERGAALWTTDRTIYFMSDNGLWQRFLDLFSEDGSVGEQ